MRQKNCHVRGLLFLAVLFALPATPGAAQDRPEWEVFGGYSYARANVREYFRSTPIIFTFRNRNASMNGWEAAVTENINSWLGGTLDVRGQYRSADVRGTNNTEQMYTIMYGPRVYRPQSWGTPFAHVLAGAAHARVRANPTGPRLSDLSFALAVGGGVDVRVFRKAAIRVIQAEYLRANALGSGTHGFRVSAGLVLHLGQRN